MILRAQITWSQRTPSLPIPLGQTQLPLPMPPGGQSPQWGGSHPALEQPEQNAVVELSLHDDSTPADEI